MKQEPSQRTQANHQLAAEIKHIFEKEKARSGSPRITKRLKESGKQVNRKRVAKIMKDNGWRAKAARKYKATTNSNHNLPVAPNLLEQNFDAEYANQKWVSDITYSVPGVQGKHGCLNEPRIYLKFVN